MSNLHLGMSGVYKVVTKAQFCEFPKEILVDVYVRPKMIVIPNVRTLYQIAGGNTTIIKVIIAGGVPMPQREHLVWYKGSKPLQVTRNGRVKIQNDEWLEKTDHSKDDITQSKPKRIDQLHCGTDYQSYKAITSKLRMRGAEDGLLLGLPVITSVTSSPHVAVEDSSDILHVDLKNDEDLTSIDWYYNGKLIEIEDKHYSFPGSLPGRPDSRKILKMSNLHLGMSGVYKVVTKAQFCEFPKEILVDVYVRPKMIVIPNVRTLYQIAGGNTTIIKVIIAGGVPMPQREHLVWYKGSKPLQVTRNGRVKIQNDEWLEKTDHSKDDITQSKPKRIGWNSTLSITSPHVTDSGKYFFMVSFPKTNYTVERIIKVTKL
ncbi:Coagulation factor V [Paramuricea clavata]|uniref:Coagulation factor V n=1 Tax=Paramuricea clavata TaxID=317549 RepID=A0A7D9IJM5_PARCT|nr:Coagulation factor V [Paramuricea clavata]